MIYKFECEHCNTTEDISMPMKKYSDEQYCPKCNSKMKRSMDSYTKAAAIWRCSGAYGINRD